MRFTRRFPFIARGPAVVDDDAPGCNCGIHTPEGLAAYIGAGEPKGTSAREMCADIVIDDNGTVVKNRRGRKPGVNAAAEILDALTGLRRELNATKKAMPPGSYQMVVDRLHDWSGIEVSYGYVQRVATANGYKVARSKA